MTNLKEKLEARIAELTVELDGLEVKQKEALKAQDWMKHKDISNDIYTTLGRRHGVHDALMMVIYGSC